MNTQIPSDEHQQLVRREVIATVVALIGMFVGLVLTGQAVNHWLPEDATVSVESERALTESADTQ